ncbi:zinc finger protein 846-like [Anopheles cruzii]|uniref:zinc finger protein 846-like n=1 Tax=Anopheles cruzii TaxID=68878 RepID=UPI0022EC7EFA|nr:zinc finger protein 846-like [Anopheles cruzii]
MAEDMPSVRDPEIIYLDRICRTCLVEKEKDQLKDLFEYCLAETIMSCSGVSITESDGLPCHICLDCCTEMERCCNFRQMSEQSDATIRSLIEKSVVIKQDSETKYEVLNVVLTDSNGNTETSAVVVPIEEFRFQLMNTHAAALPEQREESAVGGVPEPHPLPAVPKPVAIITPPTVAKEPEEEYAVTVNPSELLNEPAQSPPAEMIQHVTGGVATEVDLKESIILRNLKRELSEFIGSSCNAMSKEAEIVDDNEDDEMIHVNYLKDALTEEYIQIMEHQLASSVSASGAPPRVTVHPGTAQEQLEQEHLNNLINASMEAEEPRSAADSGKTEPNEDTRYCKLCDMQFTERRLYRKHVRRKHSEKRFECSSCPRKFAEKSLLSQHLLRHTGEKAHGCKVCDARFYDKPMLNLHMRSHSGVRPYACELCDKRFATRSSLTTHLKVHGEPRPHVCAVCQKGFKLSWQLKAHSRIHTNEKPFECPHCQKRFNQNGNLIVHIRTHSGERPYQCRHCDKAYPSQSELTGHMRQHTGEKKEKKFPCSVCSMVCAANCDLVVHMRTHTKERPFDCVVCGKRFMLHVHLTVHMRSHTGEKPFACTVCEKAFATSYQLKTHNYIHTGEKNYACDVCNRKFSNAANRNTHRKTHDRKIS